MRQAAAARSGRPEHASAPAVARLRAKALVLRWKHTRPGRANARFRARSGGVLSGGIAYAALFSVFAALTISYTAFIAVLGDNDELREQVLLAIDATCPTCSTRGTGRARSTRRRSSCHQPDVAGIVAVVVLLLSAIAAMAALRTVGARDVRDEVGGNPMVGKARDLGGFVGMAFAVLLSAMLTTGVGSAARGSSTPSAGTA